MTIFEQNPKLKHGIFLFSITLCLFPFITAPLALLFGFIITFLIGNPFEKASQKLTKILLQFSIVGLGFGMNLTDALQTGKDGFLFTIGSITVTLIFGILLGKLFKIPQKTGFLISAGTAICGGSAIAALTPILKAKESDISVSLATVFILNSIALFLFPFLGHLFGMSQSQFGMWCAIAIHDTSSVVGAAQRYGDTALHIATTVKLQRALWIIPLSLLTSFFFKNKDSRIAIPYFIFLFVLAMLWNSYFPSFHHFNETIVMIAKKGLVVTLFLIGAGLTRESLKKAGLRPLAQGIILWTFISVLSFIIIRTTLV
ncbi:YeiH family protein [Flavobacterium cerinum]|uniref:Sulfate exporter family transporter n=1 Tax=Flavobacterium cerinum TaxID=2502784 RepID=A0ABY5ISJ3_9FLAO|nr:putative sulfate exporter family transporter [Flavobacterium cerinum]UUC44344.1 putative sulfate exporter family transporter [Flavobacterium cerinum]